MWDRLPMTLGFMGLFVALVAEHIGERVERWLLLMYPGRYTHRVYLLHALGFYVLAKLAETADRSLYGFTAHTASGHTLKHLLAASALGMMLLMLWRRAPMARRVSG